MNKKSVSPEDKVQIALEEMARDISLIEPNPQDWAWWVGYLLEKLEEETQKRGKGIDFKETLKVLLHNYRK